MYYPIGWPKKLDVNKRSSWIGEDLHGEESGDILLILGDQQREIFLILTTISIHLWYSRPIVEIVCHRRSNESIDKCGHNKLAAWRPDSSTIVISTTKDHILFYEIRQRLPNTTGSSSLGLFTSRPTHFATSNEDTIYKLKSPTPLGPGHSPFEPVPALMLYLFGKLDFSSIGVSALMAADEELIVASRSRSDIYGVLWDGSVDEHFPWSLRSCSEQENDVVVVDIKYSSILSGFSLVMSTGSCMFMPRTPPQLQQDQVIEVSEITDAVCTSMNHKYKLIAFGLRSSKGILCNISTSTGSNDQNFSSVEPQIQITINHELVLPSNRYPESPFSEKLGTMICIEFTPDQTACISAWQNGGFAIWSVFGSLLSCSYSWWDRDLPQNPFPRVTSLVWGRHGYSLWMSTIGQRSKTEINETQKSNSKNKEKKYIHNHDHGHVVVMSFLKSALISNPDLACSTETIILLSDDRLYIDLNPSPLNLTSGSSNSVSTAASSQQQFHGIEFPVTYLNANWPIRFVTIDSLSESTIAIAGRTGIAIYSLQLKKWKIFNNEAQERDFQVCGGGLIWWFNFLLVSCYNLSEQRFELRAYPSNCKLDTVNATIVHVRDEIVLMSVHESRLMLLDSMGMLRTYSLNCQTTPTQSVSLQLEFINQISLLQFNLDLDHVISIALSKIHQEVTRHDYSVLLNVAGKLLLIEQNVYNKQNDSLITSVSESNDAGNASIFRISILATSVENYWIAPSKQIRCRENGEKIYLMQSLWLHRGSVGGLEVWLPLLTDSSSPSPPHQYIPERIMLSVNLTDSLYPLSIMFNDAIALGAENDSISGAPLICSCPFQTVTKRTQVYLHHILRELLVRNLGFHAWNLARQHELLPYFAHSFELLLHQVLEAEATSTQPITDPLLPMIVKFIAEFPVYLETVVHCARKTDVAMWPHLFSVVGNPRRLFQRCLSENKLDIAASCIIILHTFERNNVTQHMVSQLLEAARSEKRYHYLLDDLESFIRRLSSLSPDASPPISSN